MDKFRIALKKRLALMMIYNVIAVLFIVITGIYSNSTASGSESISGFIHGSQIGLFIGLQLVLLIYMVKYIKVLRNEEALKLLYISENDERTRHIRDKIGGTAINIIICGIGAGTVMLGFIDQTAFITLFGALFFVVMVKAFLKIYYKNKL